VTLPRTQPPLQGVHVARAFPSLDAGRRAFAGLGATCGRGRGRAGLEAILVFGDAAHSAAVQFALPAAGLSCDSDPVEAAATRARLLDRLATDRTLVAGCHMPFPGIGHVARSGAAYACAPEPWRCG
jgi:hypothetical protein